MESLNEFLSILIQLMIALAIPVLVAVLVPWIIQRYRETKQRLGAEQVSMLESGISMAVRAAEQAGLTGQIKAIGAEKKAFALASAQNYVNRLGLKINVEEVSDLLEAEVNKQYRSAAQGTAPVINKETVIDRAIDTAVLAVQGGDFQALVGDLQRGLDKNKIADAVSFVQKYLEQYQVEVDPVVAEGMLQAHLMRLKMQALSARR